MTSGPISKRKHRWAFVAVVGGKPDSAKTRFVSNPEPEHAKLMATTPKKERRRSENFELDLIEARIISIAASRSVGQTNFSRRIS